MTPTPSCKMFWMVGVPVELKRVGSSSTSDGVVCSCARIRWLTKCVKEMVMIWLAAINTTFSKTTTRRTFVGVWKTLKAQSLILGYLLSIISVQWLKFLALPDFMAFGLAKLTDSTTFWLVCLFHHSQMGLKPPLTWFKSLDSFWSFDMIITLIQDLIIENFQSFRFTVLSNQQ